MSIFDKIFGKKKPKKTPEIVVYQDDMSPDVFFVEQFKKKGGKFLYSDDESEIMFFLKNILEENDVESVYCIDEKLQKKLGVLNVSFDKKSPMFFTKCEHLIVEDGSILFSSKQIQEKKLDQYPVNFIVFAYTSQLTRDKDKALTSIKRRYQSDIPTNISAVKDYFPNKVDPNFLNYGNNNSKSLYLLLLENL